MAANSMPSHLRALTLSVLACGTATAPSIMAIVLSAESGRVGDQRSSGASSTGRPARPTRSLRRVGVRPRVWAASRPPSRHQLRIAVLDRVTAVWCRMVWPPRSPLASCRHPHTLVDAAEFTARPVICVRPRAKPRRRARAWHRSARAARKAPRSFLRTNQSTPTTSSFAHDLA